MSPRRPRARGADAAACYGKAGHFQLDALAAKKLKATGSLEASDERRVMPSFFASKGTDAPFVDASVADVAARQRFKARVATLKTALGNDLSGRPSLLAEGAQTHEMAYTRYGVGARLGRHTDEHHGALKNARPVASGDENLQRLRHEARAAERRGAERRALGDAHAAVGDVARLLERRYDAARDGGQAGARARGAVAARRCARRRPAGGVAEGDGHRRRDARLPRRELRVERGRRRRRPLHALRVRRRQPEEEPPPPSPSPRAPTSSSPAAATPPRGGSPASSTAEPTASAPPRRRGALGCYVGGGRAAGERGADGGRRAHDRARVAAR